MDVRVTSKYYIAGLFDGEGYITLQKTHKARYRSPHVSISNTEKDILDFVLSVYGGRVRPRIRASHVEKGYTTCYDWEANGNLAIEFITDIRPYMMHTKKCMRADLLIQEYKSVTPRNGKYTPELTLLKEDFEKRFMDIRLRAEPNAEFT